MSGKTFRHLGRCSGRCAPMMHVALFQHCLEGIAVSQIVHREKH